MLFAGEPGIGKTALARRAIEDGSRRGYHVLAAAPTSAESSLSFASLGDLLADAHDLFRSLPAPQRAALEVALLLEEQKDTPSDARAIGLALVAVLHELCKSRAVLVVVDDIHWIDGPSAAALSFAVRRMAKEPFRIVLSTRTGAAVPADLDRRLRTERIHVAGLSTGAIHSLLTTRLGLSIPRMLLLRIQEASHGNPLIALELGRALEERGFPEPGEPFGLPADAEGLLAARLARLPDATLDVLTVVALTATPTPSLVRDVTGHPAGVLKPALAEGVIRVDGERIHFVHPLLASAVDARLDESPRRAWHRRIASAVTDPEQHARHLALGAERPDATTAAAVDEAVGRASGRGAHATAAELAALAVKLTPVGDPGALQDRRLTAANEYLEAGDAARARPILRQLSTELPAGTRRAGVLLRLAAAHSGDVNAMLPLRRQAVQEAAPDATLLIRARSIFAETLHAAGQPKHALEEAVLAAQGAEDLGDVGLRADTLSRLAMVQIWSGRFTPEVLERALALPLQTEFFTTYGDPRTVDGLRLMMLEDDLDGARARLQEAESAARKRGSDNMCAILLSHLADVECRAGRFDVAAGCAAESFEIRDQLRFANSPHYYPVALADTLRGNVESAREAATKGTALAEETGNHIWFVRNKRVLGFLALSTGDTTQAGAILVPLAVGMMESGYGPAQLQQFLPDAIEALIATGKLEEAIPLIGKLDDVATAIGTAWARVRLARCRGTLAAAQGDGAGSTTAFEEALRRQGALPDPLERGRTLLAYGQVLRRAGQRRHARELLSGALAIFEEIGAGLWLDQARSELARLGGRVESRDALTGAEERVARLVADGLSNREVAAAIHVTERTVETHLSSIYRKLDVRSRTQLARALAARSPRTQ